MIEGIMLQNYLYFQVSLGLTTLLTIAVILNIVATEMPKADTLPLLGLSFNCLNVHENQCLRYFPAGYKNCCYVRL